MKKLFIPTLAIVTLFASCAKEPQVVNNDSTGDEFAKVVEFKATINNEDVKTDYNISGSTAYFHWTGTETIGRLWFDGSYFGHDPFVSTTSADANETSLVFSGVESANQTAYAMYPIWNGTSKTGIGWSSSPFKLYLHESMAYDVDNPLKNVVPMIGKLNGAGEFEFVPVCGVIAVTVKNLPPTATKITLSSSMAMSGNYRLTSTPSNYAPNIDYVMTNGLTTRLAWNDLNETSTKSYTFSGLDRNQHIFYFPVSVAKNGDYDDRYNGMTITVYAGSDVLQTVTTTNKITVDRGQIVRFPTMDLAKATKVAIDGDAARFYAYLTALGPDAAKVKVAVASTADAALTAAASSSKIITATGDENKVEVSDALSTSGKYYLAYRVYTSTDVELYSNTQPVFFVNSTDAAAIAGTFSRSVTGGEVLSGYEANAPTTAQFKFIVSTDPTKGNIMMTAMDNYDPFTSNIPGVFKPDTEPSHALWLRFYNADLKKGFDTSKYLFNGSSPTSNDLIFEFTSDEKNTLFVGAGAYGVATTNSYPPTWYYVYYGNSGYPYAKQ